jgi:nucleotide-binding universal stress UspA family protein
MKRFKNILYVSERTVAQDVTVARAVSLAQNNQASLTVIDVVAEDAAGIGMPPGGPISVQWMKALIDERRGSLEALVAPHREQVDIGVEVLVGRRFIEVIRAVLRNDRDLVIKPAENPAWIDTLFGSDDMHLLRKCPCPVWLMGPHERSNYRSIVAAVGLDAAGLDSEEEALSADILELAGSLALSDFAELHVVHVWDAPWAGFVRVWAENPEVADMAMTEAERARHHGVMDHLMRRLRKRIGEGAYTYLSPQIHMPQGAPGQAIPALVRELDADLVVMGTVARTGIPGLIIGNTAEAVLSQLRCSVLAIKPSAFVSPVIDDG